MSLSGRFSDQGPELVGWLGLERGPVAWWAHGRTDGQQTSEAAAGLGVGAGELRGDLIWVWVEEPARDSPFHQGRFDLDWRLPGPLSVMKLGGGLGLELVDGEALSRHLGLSYLHPSGCLSLGLDGWLDSDREWPDLVASVQFLPSRR